MKLSLTLTTLCIGLVSSCATYNKSPVATYEGNDSEDGSMNQLTNTDKKTRPLKVLNSSKKLVISMYLPSIGVHRSNLQVDFDCMASSNFNFFSCDVFGRNILYPNKRSSRFQRTI